MTKELIESIRQVFIPVVKKELLEINYEGLGKSDAEEFEKDLNEILDLSIKALEQQPIDDCVSRQVINELFNSEIKMYEERMEIRKGANYHDETERIKEFRCRIANTEYWQDKIKELPPVTPTHGTCKDCKHYIGALIDNTDNIYKTSYCRKHGKKIYREDFYCADFERSSLLDGSN